MPFHFKKIWFFKYNYILVIIITLLVVYFLGAFLYSNFYKSIAQTELIALLKTEVALEVIDTELFDEIRETDKNKKAGTPNLLTPPQNKWLNLKNPFVGY